MIIYLCSCRFASDNPDRLDGAVESTGLRTMATEDPSDR